MFNKICFYASTTEESHFVGDANDVNLTWTREKDGDEQVIYVTTEEGLQPYGSDG